MSHVSADPKGSFAVSDDGTYTFLSEKPPLETRGTLSAADFENVEAYLSSPDVEALYEHAEPHEPELCETDENGWYLQTTGGTACFVTTNVADETSRERLDFFVRLFLEAATAHFDAGPTAE